MEQAIDTETEELSKREKYRERRGEEYDIVSKVAFLIGVPDSHWKSQYTGLDADIYEQLNENKNARIIRNLCGLRTEIERNFKRFSMLILMELKNLHTIPQTQAMVNQLHKDGIDILRQRTGMPELFGLSVKAETKSKVKSIEISLEQTAADEVKDRYANEYGICMHDTTEWLLISSEGTITYNRRVASVGRVSLQYGLKDKVAEFLKVYDDQSVFSHPKGHSTDTVQDEIRKTYRIVVTHDDGDTSVLEGSFDKDGLPDNWPDFVGRLTDFFQDQSLGMLFDSRVYSKVLRKSNEVAFCGVDIDGVVRTRYYRCGDEICEGDTVVVPTPMKHTLAIGRAVEIRYCPKDQIPKEMAQAQEILGLAKETE